jgi:outer membrane immunogenic protein
MRKYLLAALLAGTIVTPAFAQDAGPFSGLRVEGIAGYDRLGSSDDGDDETIDGVTYGVGAGFDFDLGGLVVGIDAEYSDSTGKKSYSEAGETATLKTGRDIYVGGRLGFRAGPTTLIYGKAGYTNLALGGSFAEGGVSLKFDGETDGWRLGAGVEQLFGPNAYGKLEYRYSNYGGYKASVAGLDLDDLDGELNVDRHQVVAGIGFRF